MLKLEGMALKFDTENVYNETMEHGALDAFLAKQGNKPLSMGFMHDFEIGQWTKLEKRDGGLYVEGFVAPTAEKAVRALLKTLPADGSGQQLSVTFRTEGDQRYLQSDRRRRVKERKFGRAPSEWKTVDHLHVRKASLSEISLVDEGAVPGTWFKVVNV